MRRPVGPSLALVLIASCTPDSSPPEPVGTTRGDDTTTNAPEDSTGADTGTGPDDTSDDDPATNGVTTQPPAVCGNGILESIEECDDGNMVDGDGCNSDCTLNLDTSIWQTTHAGDASIRDAGHGVAVDSAGNIVVGGYEIDTVGNPDMWVAKYDPDGNQLWAISMDPSGGLDDRIYGVAIDPMDNILLVGDSDVAATSSDIWVGKLDPDGAEQWSTTFDGPDNGDDGGRGVASDAAGNLAITGFVRESNNDIDIFVAMLDPGGGTLWTDQVAGPESLDDRGQGVGVDSEGNVLVGGYVSYGGFNRNVWIRKYDPAGAELWTEEWDSPTMADDVGFGLTVAPDDSVVVAGMTPVIATNQDVWLGRWDSDGMLQWFKQFGSQFYINDSALGVTSDGDNNFIVVGYQSVTNTDTDIWMRKYDVGGNVVWSQIVVGAGGDRDEATAAATDADGNIAVTGEIRNSPGNDGDIWIGKFAPN